MDNESLDLTKREKKITKYLNWLTGKNDFVIQSNSKLNISLPKEWKKKEENEINYFPCFVQKFLLDYKKIIKKNFTSKDKKNDVDQIIKSICTSLRLFYNGKSYKAYVCLTKGLKKIIKKLNKIFPEHKSKKRIFFRGRKTERVHGKIKKKKDLFHVPFENRYYLRAQRYSINGFPCLYLGSSVYIVWEELGRPNINNLFISKYKIKNSDLNLLDLSWKPRIFALVMESRLEERKNRENGGEYLRNILNEIENYLICYPLIFACSIISKYDKDSFKPEYIIPHCLTQWIVEDRNDNTNSFDGILYFSTKSKLFKKSTQIENNLKETLSIEKLCQNIVLPVSLSKPIGQDNKLRRKFEISLPKSYQTILIENPNYFSNLSKQLHRLNKLDIYLEGGKTNYFETIFGYLELHSRRFYLKKAKKFLEDIVSKNEHLEIKKEYFFIDVCQIFEINIINKHLKIIPDSIENLTTLRVLNLSSNDISELPESIGKLSKLERLDLSNNNLKKIPKTIQGLEELKDFKIKGNKINELPKEFQSTKFFTKKQKRIKYIISKKFRKEDHDIVFIQDKKKINKIFKNAEKEVKNIIYIYIDNKLINSLIDIEIINNLEKNFSLLSDIPSRDFGNDYVGFKEKIINRKERTTQINIIICIITITILVLSNQSVSILPTSIDNLTDIEILVLKRNNLKDLPKEIGKFNSLTELDLSENNLKSIPKEIGKLNSLTELDLSENNLKSIPNEVFHIKSLISLNLTGNRLKILPSSLKNLKKLKFLSIKNNNIKRLPEIFKNLQNLDVIKIEQNLIEKLPEDFKNHSYYKKKCSEFDLTKENREIISEIQILVNSNKYIISLNEEEEIDNNDKLFFIEKNNEIINLSLKEQNLKMLPLQIINLFFLEKLDLSGNNLKDLPKEIGRLNSLTELNLSENNLNDLPKELGQLNSLTELNLSGNNLNDLPEEIGNLSDLKKLYLSSDLFEQIKSSKLIQELLERQVIIEYF